MANRSDENELTNDNVAESDSVVDLSDSEAQSEVSSGTAEAASNSSIAESEIEQSEDFDAMSMLDVLRYLLQGRPMQLASGSGGSAAQVSQVPQSSSLCYTSS